MESLTKIFNYIILIWVTDTAKQQYIMAVRIIIKLQIGLEWLTECHRVRFWDLYFFLVYINDLPKIINKTSKPIIFADDTSILFTHSNLIDLNKNINKIFETLNKWLIANELFLTLIKQSLYTLQLKEIWQ